MIYGEAFRWIFAQDLKQQYLCLCSTISHSGVGEHSKGARTCVGGYDLLQEHYMQEFLYRKMKRCDLLQLPVKRNHFFKQRF